MLAVRLHCVDDVFLAKYIDSPLFADPKASKETRPTTSYPHRLAFLRPELLTSYRSYKLQQWMDERVAEASAEIEASKEKLQIEVSKPEGSTEEKSAPVSPVIDAADFPLRFNPDAFVERKSTINSPSTFIYDPEEPSSKAVHDASAWLNDSVLSNFVGDIVANMLVFTDGFFLTRLMHRKGINMRYLGVVTDLVEQEFAKTTFGEILIADAHFTLRAFKVGSFSNSRFKTSPTDVPNFSILVNSSARDGLASLQAHPQRPPPLLDGLRPLQHHRSLLQLPLGIFS